MKSEMGASPWRVSAEGACLSEAKQRRGASIPERANPLPPATNMHHNIPKQYKQYWHPYKTQKTLFHLTTKINFKNIKKIGHIEPRDPSPKHWSGMKAIFLSDPDDSLYADSLKHVLAHVKEKHEELLRLHIKTNNELYKSNDPKRTFQIISLDRINIKEIIKIEILSLTTNS
ncbi:MAG: hypothetical protein Q8O83_00195 [bacterium]|nr:hypothetical protein [bacterium]